MADDTQGLVVLLEARIRDFERNMEKASRIAATNFDAVERRSALMSARLQSTLAGAGKDAFSGLAKGAALAFAPILSMHAAIDGAKDALEQFSKINDESKASGLDAEFFQGVAYQAQLGGIAYDDISGALELFNKNAGLAVAAKGKMYAALKVLNPELLTNLQTTTSQEQRVRLAANAIDKEADASRKAALATTLFGDAGGKLVDVFAGGAASIDLTAQKARDLGIIIDRDLIARADELGDEFDTANKVIGIQFQETLIKLAPFLIDTAKQIGDIASQIREAVDSVESLAAFLNGAGAGDPYVTGLSPDAKNKFRADIESAGIAAWSERNGRSSRPNLYDGFAMGKDGKFKIAPPPDPLDSGTDRKKAAEEALRQAEAVKKLISNLQFEQSLIGKSTVEQDVANALRQAGAAATDKQRAAIVTLVTEMDAQRAAIERNSAALDAMKGLASETFSGFVNDLRQGKSATDALADALGNLGNRLLDMALNTGLDAIFGGGKSGGSAVSGFLGQFGIKLAGGGKVRGPGTSTSDSIPALLSDGEYVVNAAATSRNHDLLAAINSGRIGRFATGGDIGAQSFRPANDNRRANNDNAPGGLVIHAPITVNGSAGTAEQNADLANKMGRALEDTVRGIVSQELLRSLRPGNVGNTRSR